MNKEEQAKQIIGENSKILYGIFGIIETSGYFPTKELLNEFFSTGYDPCDQDNRMKPWKPFILDENEYKQISNWWLSKHPNCTISSLNSTTWQEWSYLIIET
jgi:hypothetical protein